MEISSDMMKAANDLLLSGVEALNFQRNPCLYQEKQRYLYQLRLEQQLYQKSFISFTKGSELRL